VNPRFTGRALFSMTDLSGGQEPLEKGKQTPAAEKGRDLKSVNLLCRGLPTAAPRRPKASPSVGDAARFITSTT